MTIMGPGSPRKWLVPEFFALIWLAIMQWAIIPQSAAQSVVDHPTTVIVQAQRLRETGQARQAYELLKLQEVRFAGQVEFDFQLGLSALEAGNAAQAIFALERVLLTQPNNLRARAELGRAYAQNREFEAATNELNTVKQQVLPAAVRTSIDGYLNAIALTRNSSEPTDSQLSGSFEFGLGRDTNANLGSSNSTWVGAGGLTLYPSSALLGQASNVANAGLHLAHSRRINHRWSWSNAASVGQVWNLSRAHSTIAHDFSTLDLRSGIAHKADAQEWSLTMLTQHLQIDRTSARNALGINAQWQRRFSDKQAAIQAQQFRFRHHANSNRDAVRSAIAASVASPCCKSQGKPAGKPQGIIIASASLGREHAAALPEASFRLHSLRFGGELAVRPAVSLSANVSLEKRRYDGVNALFAGQQRNDLERELKLAVNLDLGEGWSVSPSVTWTQNGSTLSANAYKRQQYYLFARYRF